jgi:23S rRNA (cytosine1962-C5)-methyltransferase
MSQSPPTRLRLHVTPAAEHAVRRGHPWVYADKISRQSRPGEAGELAVLYDRRDRLLALGLYDPGSPLRVRILHAGDPVQVDLEWWRRHLAGALGRRQGLFDERTTGWRAIHGENDGWPGLVLDRYGDVAVVKVYTAAWLPRLAELVPLFQDALAPRSIILRLSRNIADVARSRFGRTDGALLAGDPVGEAVVFLEDGLKFEAEVVRGQKTGFFLDQRENRRIVGSLARGMEVLNAFSFSGGFSLHAARAGALAVTDLDISPHALEGARRNFALNRDCPEVAAASHQTVQADTFDWLAVETRREFDLVILDPPSLARREAERNGALAAYSRLATLGASRVRRGGVLFAASCSAHVPAEEFFRLVREGVQRTGRTFRELRSTTHPPDHPARFPEAHYLKGIYLRMDSGA